MDTIISYLDNLFASLPKSEKVIKAKRDLLSSMEEKYRALKSEGKSENEAVGTVISEFGNIDELIDELGLKRTADGQQLSRLKEEDIREFLAVNRQAGLLIGLGVFLCIISVAMFFLFGLLAKDGLLARYMAPGSGSVLGLIAVYVSKNTLIWKSHLSCLRWFDQTCNEKWIRMHRLSPLQSLSALDYASSHLYRCFFLQFFKDSTKCMA
jgi:hypothetical protein